MLEFIWLFVPLPANASRRSYKCYVVAFPICLEVYILYLSVTLNVSRKRTKSEDITWTVTGTRSRWKGMQSVNVTVNERTGALLAAAAWWNWSLGISSDWSSGDAPRWNKRDVDLFSLCLPIWKSSWPSQHLQKLKLNGLKRNFLLIATWHICKQRNILIFEGRRPTVRDWISKFIDDARLKLTE